MNTRLLPATLALALLSGPLPAASTAVPATLRELVAQPGYRQAWDKAVQPARLPRWARLIHGPATPVNTVEFNGARYTVGWACKPHDCAANFLYGAFSADGRQAWALRVTVDNSPDAVQTPSRHARYQWIGSPDATIRALLDAELNKDPNWR